MGGEAAPPLDMQYFRVKAFASVYIWGVLRQVVHVMFTRAHPWCPIVVGGILQLSSMEEMSGRQWIWREHP